MQKIFFQGIEDISKANTILRSFEEGNRIYLHVLTKNDIPELLIIPNMKKVEKDSFHQIYNEFNITKLFYNPKILKINNIIEYPNFLCLVANSFDGIPLSTYLSKESISLTAIIEISLQILDAISELHQHNFIHRNLNSFNILINPNNNNIKLTGFGESVNFKKVRKRVLETNSLNEFIEYYSPESTGKTIYLEDERSDLYSLGILIFNLLFQTTPFHHKSLLKLIHLISTEQPNISEKIKFKRNIPDKVVEMVVKLLEKSPDRRYQSITSLKYDLMFIKELINNSSIDQLENMKIAQNDLLTIFYKSNDLFGREIDINHFQEVYTDIQKGSKKFFLIYGSAGIGKSAFIDFITRKIITKHFLIVKLDQYKKELHFNLLISALRKFIDKLLIEEEFDFEWWQLRFKNELGEAGQVLREFIPELEKFIKFELKYPERKGLEALNRFKIVLQKFINCLSSSKFPLILIIEDVHWANQDIVEFVNALLQDIDLKYFSLILTFRPEDIIQKGPVSIALEEIKSKKRQTSTVVLKKLPKDQIKIFLGNFLHSNKLESDLLLNMIENRTLGNPLLLKQFIRTLEIKKLLFFDINSLTWNWEINSIKSITTEENLTNLIINYVQNQSESNEIIKCLQIASCIGNTFNYDFLNSIYSKIGINNFDLSILISKAVYLGLILLETNNNFYYFQHDSIREYFYKSIDKELKKELHLLIGRKMLEKKLDLKSDMIFSIVDHFNLSIELIKDKEFEEQINVAKLNLYSGQKLLHSIAYKSSLDYLQKGVDILPTNSWMKHKDLTLSLYQYGLEAAYLNFDQQILDSFAEEIKKNSNDIILSSYAISLQIRLRFNQLKFEESLNIGLKALNEFNIQIQLDRPLEMLFGDFLEFKRRIQEITLEKFTNSPEIQKDDIIAKITVLESLLELLYTFKPELYPNFVFKMFEFSLDYGNHKFLGNSLANMALLSGGLFHDLKFANQLSLAGLQRLDTSRDKFIIYFGSYSWTHHYKDSLVPLKELIDSYIETGEFAYSGFAAYQYCYTMLQIGYNLSFISDSAKDFRNIFIKTKDNYNYMMITILYEVLRKFQGKNDNFSLLEEQIIETQNSNLLCHYYSLKLFYDFFYDDTETIIQTGELAIKYSMAVIGSIEFVSIYFFFALAIMRNKRRKINQSEKLDAILQEIFSKFEIWTKHGSNFEQKSYLLKAESYRLQNDFHQAMKFYEKAIFSAKKSGYFLDEALAYELGAEFFFDNNIEEIGHFYINSAINFYNHWGAGEKIKTIKQKYKIKTNREENSNPYRNLEEQPKVLSSLDYSSLLKTIQIISLESDLNKLIKSMIRIVIEQSGAELCLLLLKRDEKWIIHSNDFDRFSSLAFVTDIGQNKITLPSTLLNYCIRTKQALLIHDPLNNELFFNDEYIIKNNAKSIICLPLISQDIIRGILYLDNSISEGIFNLVQLEFIRFLSFQFIISIENAVLYQKLEEKISLRNEKLIHSKKLVEEEIKLIRNLKESQIEPGNTLRIEEFENYLESLSKILETKDKK